MEPNRKSSSRAELAAQTVIPNNPRKREPRRSRNCPGDLDFRVRSNAPWGALTLHRTFRSDTSLAGEGISALGESLQVKKPLGVFVEDLFFYLCRQRLVVAQMLEISGKLTVPMRNIRRIQEMIRSDVFDGLRQL